MFVSWSANQNPSYDRLISTFAIAGLIITETVKEHWQTY